MNDMVVFQESPDLKMSDKFLAVQGEIGEDLAGGIAGSYAILGIKGSRWSVKYQGTTTPITNQDGDPVGSFECVLVKANAYLTKQYYPKGYVEGSNEPPACFSIDGKVPAENAPEKQHTNCAACPMTRFDKVNETTGKKTKWCQDNKKMAVLPLGDLKNEMFGGPMLFRVPAASLKDLKLFGDTLKARGYSYNSVAVRLSFDLTVSYPKVVLKAIRPLNDEEAEQVLEWYKSDAVEKLLADFEDISTPVEAPKDEVFEQPPAAAPVAPKPVQAKPTPPPAAAKVPAAPPAQPAKTAGVVFGAPAKPVQAAAPVAAAPKPAPKKSKATVIQTPTPEALIEAAAVTDGEAVDTTTEQVPGNLEDDIAGILSELSSLATE